MRVDPNQLN